MNQIIPILIGLIVLWLGTILGYYARQLVAKKQVGGIEEKIQKRISYVKEKSEVILSEAKEKARQTFETTKKEEDIRRRQILRTEQLLLKRENVLENKLSNIEKQEIEFRQKAKTLKNIKQSLEGLKIEAMEKLEKISQFSKEEAKKELLQNIEKEYQKDFLEKIKKIEERHKEEFEKKAKKMIVLAIQRCAFSQSQELTTTTVSLPSDEIKGRIIGKEGRNIKVLEKLTGVEIIVDDTPEVVIISGFDPIRRQIAKIALEKLIQDGRIQPARIEEMVSRTEGEIISQIKEAGEQAIYDIGIVGLDPKIAQLLGRLKFRTSYGQNVLLHSIEVAYLAGILASELGVNVHVCRKAGLLHDIGKAVDHQVEGSHTDIGIKILEKFGVEKQVIVAMKSHHEEYPAETLEAVLVQVADQISGARPGARKDTIENYLKRLSELEAVATSFKGVEKTYAIQAGREIRVFVKPEEIDDLAAQKLAREIADRIQEELRYPGEIKVNVIRESRVVEYAK